MAEIRAFHGVRYNQQIVSNLAAVICPPYDIISPQQQDELYRKSEYNFVRVEYNREQPQDTPEDNRYTRASATLKQWLQQGILKTEDKPAIYIHDHYFNHQGKQCQRRNLFALVKLEEWDRMVIRPHENVLPRAKSDRLSMLWTCQANTSPVLTLYGDPERTVASILTQQERNKPIINVTMEDGEKHKVWAVTQPEVIEQIHRALSDQPFYIADGHHRYDSALTYRRERMNQSISATGKEPFNFVMMSLVDFEDPGMLILPPHRLLRGIPKPVLANLRAQLEQFFEIKELFIDSNTWQKVDKYLTGMRPEMEEVNLALFGLETDRIYILTVRDFNIIEPMMPYFHGKLYKKLDVSLVDHVIMEKLLSINKDKEEISLAYSYDREDAIKRVINQEYQLTFLLNQVKPGLIRAIADAGDRMPRKSTYFYPKSPAGLVLYRW